MSLLFWLDTENALKVDHKLQMGLLLVGFANSCVFPLVYGGFHFGNRNQREHGICYGAAGRVETVENNAMHLIRRPWTRQQNRST